MQTEFEAARGIRALGIWGAGSLARSLGWDRVAEWANRPVMELSDMQPVTASWWRARRKQPGELLYLALGDSTAQGIGASSPGLSYVGQLATRIEERIDAPIRVTNLAVSGATSALCASNQLPRAEEPLAEHPEIVTLAIGANDIADWDPVAFHRNLNRILDALPGHTILGELPCFFLPRNERKVATANRMIHRIAEARGLDVAPVHSFTGQRGVAGILTEFAADAFHPNDHGYRVWADAFWPLIEARLRELGR